MVLLEVSFPNNPSHFLTILDICSSQILGIYSILPVTYTSGLLGTSKKGLFAYKIRNIQSGMSRKEELVLHKMSHLRDQIFDIEMDYKGNIYYTSFKNRKVYKIDSKTHQETVLETLDEMNPEEDSIGKNLLCSLDRKHLFIRKGLGEIVVYNCDVDLIQASKNKIDTSIFMTFLKINGKVVTMTNLYDRLAVVTSTGLLQVYNYKLNSKEIIQANRVTSNLEINPLDEIASCACFSFDYEYLAIASQVFLQEGSACNRVRIYKVQSATKYKLLSTWNEESLPLECLKVFRNV